MVATSQNAKLIHTCELPATIGDFFTTPYPPCGKANKKRRRYLDKVHMDIVFGDWLALGGFWYALVLVDMATRYSWVFGLPSLTSHNIIDALEAFCAEAGDITKTFHSDFAKKLIGGKALKWIQSNNSKVIAAPARRQSSNGLVERTWCTIVTMARVYVAEKQVGREYWYFAIVHAANVINQVPGRLGCKLTTPF